MKAPFSWPNSSLSSRLSGIAAQLTATKGAAPAASSWWMARATSSLPVPLSPEDEHGRVGGAGHLDLVEDRLHGRAHAEERSEAPGLLELSPQERDFAHDIGPLHRLVDQDPQPAEVDRLGQVVIGALLHRLHRGLDGGIAGEEDDRGGGQLAAKGLQQLEPIQARHDQIGDDDRRAKGQSLFEGLGAVGRLLDLEAPGGKEISKPGARCLLVIDDQHANAHGWLMARPISRVCPRADELATPASSARDGTWGPSRAEEDAGAS